MWKAMETLYDLMYTSFFIVSFSFLPWDSFINSTGHSMHGHYWMATEASGSVRSATLGLWDVHLSQGICAETQAILVKLLQVSIDFWAHIGTTSVSGLNTTLPVRGSSSEPWNYGRKVMTQRNLGTDIAMGKSFHPENTWKQSVNLCAWADVHCPWIRRIWYWQGW